jgi:virginiamycin B lyase
MLRSSFVGAGLALCIIAASGGTSPGSAAEAGRVFFGRVRAPDGAPVSGAMVSVASPPPVHRITVYSRGDGRYRTPTIPFPGPYDLRVRRIGWKDRVRSAAAAGPLDFTLVRETDPAEVAAQLPANYWLDRVLDRIDDDGEREEYLRQCAFCHQQGNVYTRAIRDEESWRKVLLLMGRKGGMISSDLREKLPAIFIDAYDPATAVPELTAGMDDPGFGPVPAPNVRQAVIEEWDLGGPGSLQHDVMVHPDGRIYGVDMPFDKLHRLDPETGERRTWSIPTGDLPLGGVFVSKSDVPDPSSNERVGPHSLQAAPNGDVWITLATGNRLARFDPKRETFEIFELAHGFYPHTLRFDARGRIWYTISASNHLGFFDPATGEHRQFRLPARTWKQAAILWAMPLLIWLDRHVDLRGEVAQGDPVVLPIPYGIDIAPDGAVWFSQLNEHRIGRMDPDTGEIEMVDTPFPAPRRLRFDSRGRLWIPSFSGSRIARFDPDTGAFEEWELPIEPRGTETPYALHVDRRTDTVWICGTASDTIIRFEPDTERWWVYPLPTRVTFTREIDFDAQGRVWTSNSNGPAWQIEEGVPRVLRLDPRGGAAGEGRVAGLSP